MASPLTLIMPVIPGTDLPTMLKTLAEYGVKLDTALRSIGTVHYARALLLDASSPNLQPGLNPNPRYCLAIITEFDGDFNKYIHDFVVVVGEVFDALLQFVVGGPEVIPVANHEAAFGVLLARNNASQHLPNIGLFQAYDFTVQKILADAS